MHPFPLSGVWGLFAACSPPFPLPAQPYRPIRAFFLSVSASFSTTFCFCAAISSFVFSLSLGSKGNQLKTEAHWCGIHTTPPARAAGSPLLPARVQGRWDQQCEGAGTCTELFAQTKAFFPPLHSRKISQRVPVTLPAGCPGAFSILPVFTYINEFLKSEHK